MKTSTLIKAKRTIAGSLLLIAAFSQTDMALAAFGFGNADEAKVVTVYDEKGKQVITTNATSFKRVLSDLDVSLNSYDKYWTSTDEVSNGSMVVVERAVPVTIIEDGKSKVVYTTQQTVQGVVDDAGYNWKKMMPMEDGMTKVKSGMQIHVVPYTVKRVKRTETMPVTYRKWYDGGLSSDATVVVQEGTPGKREVEVEEILSGGKVIKTNIIRSNVISRETPGMAKTGNPEGAVGWVTTMHASAYHPSDGDGYGITATGTKAGHGTVAVDPSVIPLGSKVFIPNYGEAVAADTGGAIVGNRIDLCMDTFQECYSFGRRDVEVFVNY